MKITDKIFPQERALYGQKGLTLYNCKFQGEEDGESALKECENVEMHDCYMDLRYPLWHVKKATLENITMTPNCRAALWYSNFININDSKLHGIKALRECNYININDTDINSMEFGWKSSNIEIINSNITGEYAFFESSNIKIDNINFNGKYSFQYVKNLNINNSVLKTKDAFWHAENVLVQDSVLEGEYLAWYSKKVTLIDCTMEDTDFSFECSDVQASIEGEILSVKNPRKGHIVADKIKEIIIENSVYPVKAKIEERNK